MFERIFDLLYRSFSGERAKAHAREIYNSDRWFTFPAYTRTMAYCAEQLRSLGLKEVEVLRYPADARSKLANWTVPPAWDAEEATLEIIAPSADTVTLADRRAEPLSLAMFSAPTSPEGVLAEVVLVEGGSEPEHYQGLDVRGKIIFTPQPINLMDSARRTERLAVERGAIGILSDAIYGNRSTAAYGIRSDIVTDIGQWRHCADGRSWMRLHPAPMGTGEHTHFGFSLTPRQGAWLRTLLRHGKKVMARAVVRTHIYAGDLEVLTGLLPGTDPDAGEVLLMAHLCEPMANDNASAVGATIELLATFQRLIASGLLAAPRRGIRFVTGAEFYAPLAYFLDRRPSRSRFVAALNLDMVGINQDEARNYILLSQTPDSLPNFSNALGEAVWEAQARRLGAQDVVPKRVVRYGHWCDGIIGLLFGVPGIELIQWPFDYYHTSLDTLERVDPATVARVAQLAGAYVHFVAWAGEEEAVWLLGEMAARAEARLAREAQEVVTQVFTGAREASEALPWLRERAGYLAQCERSHLGSVAQLCGSSWVRERIEALAMELARHVAEQGSAAEDVIRLWAHRRGLPELIEEKRMEPRCPGPVPYTTKLLGTWANYRTRENLSVAEREALQEIERAFPDSDLDLAMAWIDGKRDLGEIASAISQEAGRPQDDFVQVFFQFLEEHGYVGFRS